MKKLVICIPAHNAESLLNKDYPTVIGWRR